jgi:hypothetical protein
MRRSTPCRITGTATFAFNARGLRLQLKPTLQNRPMHLKRINLFEYVIPVSSDKPVNVVEAREAVPLPDALAKATSIGMVAPFVPPNPAAVKTSEAERHTNGALVHLYLF